MPFIGAIPPELAPHGGGANRPDTPSAGRFGAHASETRSVLSDERLAELLAAELAAAFAPPSQVEPAVAAPDFDETGPPDLPFLQRDREAAIGSGTPVESTPETRRGVTLFAGVAIVAGLAGGGFVFGANALLTRQPPAAVAAAPAAPAPVTASAHAIATPPPVPARAVEVKVAPAPVEDSIVAAIPPIALPDGPPSAPADAERFILVESGDSLSDIAERAYGDPQAYRRIFDANRDQLERPESLKVGLRLRIP